MPVIYSHLWKLIGVVSDYYNKKAVDAQIRYAALRYDTNRSIYHEFSYSTIMQ